VVVDYHSPTAVQDLLAAADKSGTPLLYGLDAISSSETAPLVTEVLSRSAAAAGAAKKKLAYLTNWPENVTRPDGIEYYRVAGSDWWTRRQDLAAWGCKAITSWLEGGVVVPQAYRVVQGGLGSLQNALNELKKGVSGEKLLVEVN
jgi:hypothetical protein